jgi:hypothetical protein
MQYKNSQIIMGGLIRSQPELGCVVTEEWDYTYIIWHKNNGAVEKLAPFIKKAKLKHFCN